MALYCPICMNAIGKLSKIDIIKHMNNHYTAYQKSVYDNLMCKVSERLVDKHGTK